MGNDPDPAAPTSTAPARWTVIALAAIVATLFVARLAGPSDILDNDQLRPAMYALDVLRNGSWICQRDPSGDITSKPPFYTWCIALLSTPWGEVNRFTLYLPCALAMFGAACIATMFARHVAGPRAGLIAGIMVLCSSYGVKHVALARTDAMFAFAVAVTAWCAWNAGRSGRGWLWFWLAAAAATLTKGPLGLALGSMGLIGLVGGRGTPAEGAARKRSAWWVGAPVYLAICGGWFFAAWLQMGQPLIDKMIGRELVGHAVEGPGGAFPGSEFYKPWLYYLSRFLPWSPLTFLALWRLWRTPGRAMQRTDERFLAWWFVGGLTVFSLATHQRADLVLPLAPAGAALGAIELERLTRRWSTPLFGLVCAAGVLATLVVTIVWYEIVRARDSAVQDTSSVARLAERLRTGPLAGLEVLDLDAPFGLQYFRGTSVQRTPAAVALDRLEAGDDVLLATRDPAELAGAAKDRGIPIIVLDEAGGSRGVIVSLMGLPRSAHEPPARAP